MFVKTYLKKDDGDIVLYLSYSGDNGATEKYHICNESSLRKVRSCFGNSDVLYVDVKANIRKLRENLAQKENNFTNEIEILNIDIHKE